MPLFDEKTGEYNPGAFAVDTHSAYAEQSSIFEDVGNVFAKGLPLVGLSIVNSFANTGIQLANFFGAEIEPLKAEQQLRDLGWDSYAGYYERHAQGIEAGGLIVGSLIPGLAAVKAVKMAQAGKMTEPLSRATNLFMSPTSKVVDEAIAGINSNDGIFANLSAQKFKAVSLGVRDQLMQSFAYEVATVATMVKNPVFDSMDLQDIAVNMLFGTIVGGTIGGALEGIGTVGKINRALLNSDIATKPTELTTRYGLAEGAQFDRTSIAGDRVIGILDSIDKIKNFDTETILGERKASTTVANAVLDAKKMLQELASPEDKELTNNLFDMIYTGMNKGMTKEEAYNTLNRLASVDRVGADASIPTTDTFYLNRFAKGTTLDFDNVATVAPLETAELSKRYRLAPGSTEPSIVSYLSTFVDENGIERQLYKNATEAFKDGHDIFIGARNGISVNPKAPNIIGEVPRPGEARVLSTRERLLWEKTGKLPPGAAPLYSEPVIVNFETGAISTSVEKVVGDFGTPSLTKRGLKYGSEETEHNLDNFITSETSATEANSRYVWAAKRGFVKGDTIDIEDTAMLENLYKEGMAHPKGWDDFIETLEKKGVTLSEGELPVDANEALNLVRNAKNDLIHSIYADADPSKINSEAIALMANVKQSYLENKLIASGIDDYIINPAKYETANHGQLSYNIGNVFTTQDGNILRGWEDSQARMKIVLDNARTTATHFFGTNAEDFLITDYTAADATIQGTGPKAFSYSNANYGTLAQKTERMGRVTNEAILKRNATDMEKLVGPVNVLRQTPIAGTELSAFTFVRQSTGEAFRFIPKEIAAAAGLSEDTVVLTKSISFDQKGMAKWNRGYVPEGFIDGDSNIIGGINRTNPNAVPDTTDKAFRTFYQLSSEVAAIERAQQQINDLRTIQTNNFYKGMGLNKSMPIGNLYAPPIDTRRFPFFALVKGKEGMALGDDSVSIIVGRTADELNQKISLIRNDFDIITKDMGAKYHQVEGDYIYDRNFASNTVNSELRRRGILNNMFPEANVENTISALVNFNANKNTRLIRDMVELGNSQLFAELRAVGERFTATGTSQFAKLPFFVSRTVENPYNDYINQALGVTDRSRYRLWHEGQEMSEAFASTAFNTAKSAFFSAKSGAISYEEANRLYNNMGLGSPYAASVDALRTYTEFANHLPSSRILTKFVSTANAIQAATAIRLDAFQTLINVTSAPILMFAETNSAIRGLMETVLPNGSGIKIPSPMKLAGQAISNWFDKGITSEWMPVYQRLGIIRQDANDYYQLLDHMTLPYGKFTEAGIEKKIGDMVELGSKITFSKQTETFIRWVAADIARQMFTVAGKTGSELTDDIITFVNRVHGNYVASQRPIAFQGPIGQAMSLFQTYQFNLLQQMFRYVQNGEGKSLAILAGLQQTIFGFQSLPGFQMVNQHLIGGAAGNPTAGDLYSANASFFGKDIGDWLMYGSLSNIMGTGLYGRGDINPRQISVLPINPLSYPAIQGAMNFIGSVAETTKKIVGGGDVFHTLMSGLEHNGLSRPLSGLGQLMQGYATTSNEDLVAKIRYPDLDTLGWNDVVSAAQIGGRIAGARPLQEAINMDALYRDTLYKAKEVTRMQALGEAAKTEVYAKGGLEGDALEEFAHRYAVNGGYMPSFGQAVMRWTKDATVSRANEIYRQLSNPRSKNLQMILGGTQLPDFMNMPSTSVAEETQ